MSSPVFLAASSVWRDPSEIRHRAPGLWRRVRRFNPAVQLALAAADSVVRAPVLASGTVNPSSWALVSLAPCHSGSRELFQWVDRIHAAGQSDRAPLRMNPTHTLHAVDNLALSALAIALGHRGYGCGLGGAAGMAWEGLQMLIDRLQRGTQTDGLLVAGDQLDPRNGGPACGVAVRITAKATLYAPLDRRVALTLDRQPGVDESAPRPHAAEGLAAWLAAVAASDGSPVDYEVPAADGDGIDRIAVRAEVS